MNIWDGVISGGYTSPEKRKAFLEKREQERQAYGERYAKQVIAKYPSLAPQYDYYVREGKLRWSQKMFAPSKNEDYTSTLAYLDERMQPDHHTYLMEMWEEEFYTDKDGVVRPKARPLPKEPRHHRERPFRPYIGCPDCPRWDQYKGCKEPFENTKLCEEIEERYKEKGE